MDAALEGIHGGNLVARHRPHGSAGVWAAMRAAEFLAILCHVMR